MLKNGDAASTEDETEHVQHQPGSAALQLGGGCRVLLNVFRSAQTGLFPPQARRGSPENLSLPLQRSSAFRRVPVLLSSWRWRTRTDEEQEEGLSSAVIM